ncbi:methionine--tRNA ligase [Methylophilaceae bacterium]|jgi:methionyl-tRNA synthetase|nr:methionine--tRNA ligase [Methylophilaceae bacterium]|tara:strand:- start:14830 stop:16485 length:1656 start_codon:yes stop_codon:yes gene_type:complete
MRKILVTSALPYANGSIHLGHLVEYIQTDIWVRFQKMQGNIAYYICADDTHGTPIMLMAEQENISPEELVEKIHKEHSKDFEDFCVNFDNFYSTNSSENKELSEEVYRALVKNNKIFEKEIEQYYDPDKKMFLPDRFIKGECPKCKTKDQYGDSCESCGSTYNPTDLINPYSVLTGAPPVKKKTRHYFFKLSECSDFLSKWTKSGTLQKEASNKLEEWFKAGLSDWDISRDAPYFGFEIPDAPGKFFYVWLDAPIGYMASFKNFAKINKLSFNDFWKKNSEAELVHFIGKDILYFHALFWPATLEYSGYRKPTKIYAHGFLTVNGEKMSKSRGTFITARSYLDHIKNPNFLRYYYASKLNESMEDIDLNLQDFSAKVNSDLVGKFINIPSRTSGFISKYFENKLVPLKSIEDKKARELILGIINMKDVVLDHYELRMFSKLIKLLMGQVEALNEFVSQKEPWVLAKNKDQHKINSELHQICSTCLNAFRLISIYLTPVIPELSSKIALFFNESPYESFSNIETEAVLITNYVHLLQRLDLNDIEEMVNSNK